jgi:hypothetical protein
MNHYLRNPIGELICAAWIALAEAAAWVDTRLADRLNDDEETM